MRIYKNQLPIRDHHAGGEPQSFRIEITQQKRTPAIFLQLLRPVKAESLKQKKKRH
jgi:hypothetical protein